MAGRAPRSRYGPRWTRYARRLVLIRGSQCEGCGSRTPPLHVHHRVPVSIGGDVFPVDPDCRLSGLQVLCVDCHTAEHAVRLSPGRRAWLELRQDMRRRLDAQDTPTVDRG